MPNVAYSTKVAESRWCISRPYDWLKVTVCGQIFSCVSFALTTSSKVVQLRFPRSDSICFREHVIIYSSQQKSGLMDMVGALDGMHMQVAVAFAVHPVRRMIPTFEAIEASEYGHEVSHPPTVRPTQQNRID